MGFGTPGASNYMNGCGHRLAAAGYVVLGAAHRVQPAGCRRGPGLARPAGAHEQPQPAGLRDVRAVAHDRLSADQEPRCCRSASACTASPRVACPPSSPRHAIPGSGRRCVPATSTTGGASCSNPSTCGGRGEEEGLDYGAYLYGTEDDKFNPWAAPLWPDSVLASLICPRPFMAEVGRYDSVIDWRDATLPSSTGCGRSTPSSASPSAPRSASPSGAAMRCSTMGRSGSWSAGSDPTWTVDDRSAETVPRNRRPGQRHRVPSGALLVLERRAHAGSAQAADTRDAWRRAGRILHALQDRPGDPVPGRAVDGLHPGLHRRGTASRVEVLALRRGRIP